MPRIPFAIGLLTCHAFIATAAEPSPDRDLAADLRRLSAQVIGDDERPQIVGMVERDLERRRRQANERNRAEWQAIETREDWEAYRDQRLARLARSLGALPRAPEPLTWQVTGVVAGDGFQIRNVVYESRPGCWVPGNLYLPEAPSDSMPGLVIVHSHHRDKTHGELQDMGMTWARAGCLVLVIDQVGYGERRSHTFHDPASYGGEFRPTRQDYYHRYDSGLQLRLIGDTLMGWFVWDLMRAIDLLLVQPGIDPHRIVMLGSVAGGGDPCGITAALDRRVTAAVPFNFGGLQPESYPLPENAEQTFNFAMSSYWDSTRGLPRTCSEGFFHWTIVGAIAPRPLIYAHEFAWDRERDPVWKRFQRIYGEFYGVPEKLAYVAGKGAVSDPPTVATHCTHIGRYHRQFIHPVFARWFGIDVEVADEYSNRVDPAALTCITEAFRRQRRPLAFPQLVSARGAARASAARVRLDGLSAAKRAACRAFLAEQLGPLDPPPHKVIDSQIGPELSHGATVHRVLLRTDAGISVPLLLLLPSTTTGVPVVVGVSQAGKAAFLQNRSDAIAELLEGGIAVCLPDLRGTGETREGEGRGRSSGDVHRSVNMEMFGETLLGQRLRDLRSVLSYLRGREEIDGDRLAIWGDSFVQPNSDDTDFSLPRGVAQAARQPEPLGGLLALGAGLCEETLRGVYIHRGIAEFQTALHSARVYLSHDVAVPAVVANGDVAQLIASVRGKIRFSQPVDAHNRLLHPTELPQLFHEDPSELREVLVDSEPHVADWLSDVLSGGTQ